jgi:8-oxo-dGTP diphosphatase
MAKMGIGVGVIILKDGKILLGKRSVNPEKASSFLNAEGTWTLPGGKMNFGESFEDVARREVEEETGMEVKNLKMVSVTNDVDENAHFVTIGFLCKDFSGEPKTMEPEEITEWKWFQLENLPSQIFFISEKMIKNYKENVFYKY